jgi:transcriptional regulator with XRE-family HTH domain
LTTSEDQSWGEHLRTWRRLDKKWTQPQLAAYVERKCHELGHPIGDEPLGDRLIRRWEREGTEPSLRFLDALSHLGAPEYFPPQPTSNPPSVLDVDIDSIAFVAELTDGKVVFVPNATNRRTALGGIGAIALSVFAGNSNIKPIEAYVTERKHLIAMDNLLGPRSVIPRVERITAELGPVCNTTRGADKIELMQLRVKFAEFCSWLYQDLGDYVIAQQWASQALDWSFAVRDTQLTSYIMARKSQLAGDMRDPFSASGLGQAAVSMASYRKLAAIAHTYSAHGHALADEQAQSERAYEQARELASQPDEGCEWGAWLDSAYIDVHRASSLSVLGSHREAASVFDTAIASLPDGYHRDRGVYLARAASAHAGSGDADRAAVLGLESLCIALDTQSGRTVFELVRLDRALEQVDSQPVVQLRQAIRQSVKARV